MRTFEIHLSDGGDCGFLPYSEKITVSVETGDCWLDNEVESFIEAVTQSAKDIFGVDRPQVAICETSAGATIDLEDV